MAIVTLSPGADLFSLVTNAKDAAKAFTWADFGTADERVTVISTTAASVSGHTATQTFAYTLTGGKYRLDTITKAVT